MFNRFILYQQILRGKLGGKRLGKLWNANNTWLERSTSEGKVNW